ncbi:ABC transporter substrate-binding protein [Streptomyces sp. NPDC048269]|uniref:ABC transporter substrate-binding protein n=1 Tax=Streptomyces sp. NPDC048269 TaxID=3155753 RepID=UPI0034481CB9
MAARIRIGIVGPRTGSGAPCGDMQLRGATMAIQQINARGGVGGRMLEAREYDDAGDPRHAVVAATKAVNDGVKYVVGHALSLATEMASVVYEDAGVVMITPSATSPEITARGYRLVFRTIGLDSAQAAVAGTFIVGRLPKAVGIVHDKQLYGEGLATGVRRMLVSRGVRVALFEGVDGDGKDFSAVIRKLKAAGVDFVYYGGYHAPLGRFLRQAKAEGLDAQFMAGEACADDALSRIAQDAAEGLLVTVPVPVPVPVPAAAGRDGLAHGPGDAGISRAPGGLRVRAAYAAVQVIAEAIRAAGDAEDPERVAQAIRAGRFKTAIGDLSFDEDGDVEAFSFDVCEWHHSGPERKA